MYIKLCVHCLLRDVSPMMVKKNKQTPASLPPAAHLPHTCCVRLMVRFRSRHPPPGVNLASLSGTCVSDSPSTHRLRCRLTPRGHMTNGISPFAHIIPVPGSQFSAGKDEVHVIAAAVSHSSSEHHSAETSEVEKQ